MRLLICTQKVDKNDPVLGFFHRWLEEFAGHYERVKVICLEKGEYDLPSNAKILSLGKEEGNSQFAIFNSSIFKRVRYALRFYKCIWEGRSNYDAVFVHMNQEYVLLGGLLWRLWGKRVYLWRNHAKGSWLTRLAGLLSEKAFYTSPQSFTARFKNAHRMPVGIDTDFFKPNDSVARVTNSILFLGRIAPVKKVLEFIEWLHLRQEQGESFSVTIAGAALPADADYEKKVRERILKYGLEDRSTFVGPVNKEQARRLYQTHQTYVNFTPSGSMDKTILEAAACEAKVIVANEDLKMLEYKESSEIRDFVVRGHSLTLLMKTIKTHML